MTPDGNAIVRIRLALTVVALSVAAYGCAVSRTVDYEEVDIERATDFYPLAIRHRSIR